MWRRKQIGGDQAEQLDQVEQLAMSEGWHPGARRSDKQWVEFKAPPEKFKSGDLLSKPAVSGYDDHVAALAATIERHFTEVQNNGWTMVQHDIRPKHLRAMAVGARIHEDVTSLIEAASQSGKTLAQMKDKQGLQTTVLTYDAGKTANPYAGLPVNPTIGQIVKCQCPDCAVKKDEGTRVVTATVNFGDKVLTPAKADFKVSAVPGGTEDWKQADARKHAVGSDPVSQLREAYRAAGVHTACEVDVTVTLRPSGPCPDCKGTGTYVGLFETTPCRTCQ
jgi:hypothetical protein